MEKEILAPGIILYKAGLGKDADILEFIESEAGWFYAQAAPSRSKKAGYENVRKAKGFEFLRDAENSKEKSWFNLIDSELSPYQKDYIEHYAIDTLQNKNLGYQVVSYGPDDYFSKHADEIPEDDRRISGVYYINDDYEGGGLYFDQFDIKVSPKAGDYILFPSIWAYTHTAEKVKMGTKYAIVHFIA